MAPIGIAAIGRIAEAAGHHRRVLYTACRKRLYGDCPAAALESAPAHRRKGVTHRPMMAGMMLRQRYSLLRGTSPMRRLPRAEARHTAVRQRQRHRRKQNTLLSRKHMKGRSLRPVCQRRETCRVLRAINSLPRPGRDGLRRRMLQAWYRLPAAPHANRQPSHMNVRRSRRRMQVNA